MSSHNSGSKRFGGTLTIDPKYAPALVGRRGSNIRRITQAAGHGTYIKLYSSTRGEDERAPLNECDKVSISSYSVEATKEAARLLSQDLKACEDPTSKPSRPQTLVPCPNEAAGTVIGKRGSNLKSLMNQVGNGAYIVHLRHKNAFEVTCDNQTAVELAKQLIESDIEKYFQTQKEWKDKFSQRKSGGGGGGAKENKSTKSSNSFAILDESDEEDDEADAIRQVAEQRRKERRQAKLSHAVKTGLKIGAREDSSSINSRKANDRKRWEIREWLSKQTDDSTGEPKFKPYEYTDYNTGRKRTATGKFAVPWAAVDAEIERREKMDTQRAEEREAVATRRAQENERRQYQKEFEAGKVVEVTAPSWGSGDLTKVKDTFVPEKPKAAAKVVKSAIRSSTNVNSNEEVDLSEFSSSPPSLPSILNYQRPTRLVEGGRAWADEVSEDEDDYRNDGWGSDNGADDAWDE